MTGGNSQEGAEKQQAGEREKDHHRIVVDVLDPRQFPEDSERG